MVVSMDWDSYFMRIAESISLRSSDPSTKHGCVIVDSKHSVVSTGYNGPVMGFPNDKVCYDRPEKYKWMIHAEQNAIIFAQRSLVGCTAYITGHPCCACFMHLVQSGVKRIVYGTRMSKCLDTSDFRVIDKVSKEMKIELINLLCDEDDVERTTRDQSTQV
tara:strand:+ start:202 stop:684 length:483 start_codon:yes stop_codon:yes gene_type:complete